MMRKYNYFTHATKTTKNSLSIKKILTEGFRYQEGYATISADLVHNLSFTKKGGQREREHDPKENEDIIHIIFLKKPKNKIIHYGNAATVVEQNDQEKIISGYPCTWLGGRSQLAIFDSKDKINAYIPNNENNKEKKQKLIDESEQGPYKYLNKEDKDVIFDYIPSEEYERIIKRLKRQINNLESINIPEYTEAIRKEFEKSTRYLQEGVDLEEMSTNLLYSTIEQQLMRLIRTLYLQAQKYKNYTITNGKKNREFDPLTSSSTNNQTEESKDLTQEFLYNIKKYQKKVEEKDFDIMGNDVLNRYVKRYIKQIYQDIYPSQ